MMTFDLHTSSFLYIIDNCWPLLFAWLIPISHFIYLLSFGECENWPGTSFFDWRLAYECLFRFFKHHGPCTYQNPQVIAYHIMHIPLLVSFILQLNSWNFNYRKKNLNGFLSYRLHDKNASFTVYIINCLHGQQFIQNGSYIACSYFTLQHLLDPPCCVTLSVNVTTYYFKN